MEWAKAPQFFGVVYEAKELIVLLVLLAYIFVGLIFKW